MGRSAARVQRVQKVQIFATHTDVFLRSRCPATVISTEANRSSEISRRNVASPWWQEISRLCVSLEPKVIATHTDVFLRSR